MRRLRNFLYLNTKILEDYIAGIDGYTYDEESQVVAIQNENQIAGKGGVAVVSGKGSHSETQQEEIKRSVRISDAAKFDKLYRYLQSTEDDDEGLPYFEFLTNETYDQLRREDFIEVLVTARFSKMKDVADKAQKFKNIASLLETITGKQFIDAQTEESVNGLSALGEFQARQGISCVFEFDDKHFPLVADLDEGFFRCGQERFVGQACLLCKILRKLPKGQSIKLDEILDDLKSFPLNREQRRGMSKKMDNPAIIKDEIKGPALVVLPIAVYQ